MHINDIETKLREAVMKIETIGGEYADAKALSWLLQEQRKVTLAHQMKKSPEKSIAAKEMDALASEEYRIHLEGTKEAIGQEHKLRATYDRWTYQVEALRSFLSLEKQKMKVDESLTHFE